MRVYFQFYPNANNAGPNFPTPTVPERDLAACVFWEKLEALGMLPKKLGFAGEIASAGGGRFSLLIINDLGDSQVQARGWRRWMLPGED